MAICNAVGLPPIAGRHPSSCDALSLRFAFLYVTIGIRNAVSTNKMRGASLGP